MGRSGGSGSGGRTAAAGKRPLAAAAEVGMRVPSGSSRGERQQQAIAIWGSRAMHQQR